MGAVHRSRETCEEVYRLHEESPCMSVSEIARQVQIPRATAASWLNAPGRFDPYIDEIALERAMKGEACCYQAFTLWEKREFLERLTAFRLASTPRSWAERMEKLSALETQETFERAVQRIAASQREPTAA